MLKRILVLSSLALLFVGCAKDPAPKEMVKVASLAQAPVPVAAAEPVTPTDVQVQLVVGLVRGSGEVFPVARQSFVFTPYSVTEIHKRLAARPGIPPAPDDVMAEAKVRVDCSLECFTHYEKSPGWQLKCSASCGKVPGDTEMAQYQDALAAWQKIAWDGTLAAIAAEAPPVLATTDLKGEQVVGLKPGVWYVTGRASIARSFIAWEDVPFTITPKTAKIELSNDNGRVLNL